MEIANIDVGGVMARVKYRNFIPAGLVGGFVTVDYSDPAWEGLTKTVVFKGAETKDVVTNASIIKIPHEAVVSPGVRLYIGFYGTSADGTLAIPTLWADLGLIQPAADPSGDESADPSLPVYAQLAQKVEDLKDQIGSVDPGGPDAGPAEDGGYYTPAVTQPGANKIQFSFAPSKETMPAVEPVQVELPVGQGSGGNVDLTDYATEQYVKDYAQPKGNYLTEHQDISGKLDADKLPEAVNDALTEAKASGMFDGQDGDDYVLTEADKAEIAEMAAELVEVSESAPNSGSVSSVANVAPDEHGNVPLTAENVGALSKKGGIMEGGINMNGQTLSGLNAPTEEGQAANKGYVDGKNFVPDSAAADNGKILTVVNGAAAWVTIDTWAGGSY